MGGIPPLLSLPAGGGIGGVSSAGGVPPLLSLPPDSGAEVVSLPVPPLPPLPSSR
jgi:hypothetical protein